MEHPELQPILPEGYEWILSDGTAPPSYLDDDVEDAALVGALNMVLAKVGRHERLNLEEAQLLNFVIEFPGDLPNPEAVSRALIQAGWMNDKPMMDSEMMTLQALEEVHPAPEGIKPGSAEHFALLTPADVNALQANVTNQVRAGGSTSGWASRIYGSQQYRTWTQKETEIQERELAGQTDARQAPNLSWNQWLATTGQAPVADRGGITGLVAGMVQHPSYPAYMMEWSRKMMEYYSTADTDLAKEKVDSAEAAIRKLIESSDWYEPGNAAHEYRRTSDTNPLPMPPEWIAQAGERGPDEIAEIMRLFNDQTQGLLTQQGITDPTDPRHVQHMWSLVENMSGDLGQTMEVVLGQVRDWREFRVPGYGSAQVQVAHLDAASMEMGKKYGHVLQTGPGPAGGIVNTALKAGIPWQVLWSVLRKKTGGFQNVDGDIHRLITETASQLQQGYNAFPGSENLAVLYALRGKAVASDIAEWGMAPANMQADISGLLSEVFQDLGNLGYQDSGTGIFERNQLLNGSRIGIPDPAMLKAQAEQVWNRYLFRDPTSSEASELVDGLIGTIRQQHQANNPFRGALERNKDVNLDMVDPNLSPWAVTNPTTWSATNKPQANFVLPVEGVGYDQLRDTFLDPRKNWKHAGIDIGAPTGTPLLATVSGTIQLYSNDSAGLGVGILGDDGRGYWYAHLDGYAQGISSNMRVEAGQTIGFVGETGNAAAPHLHLSISATHKHPGPSYDPARAGFLNPYEVLSGATVGNWDGRGPSSEYYMWDPDQNTWRLNVLEGTPEYQALYGRKPTGVSIDEYRGDFEQFGRGILGFQPTDEQMQVGLRSNDITEMYRSILGDREAHEKSPLLRQRLFRLVDVINQV